MPDPVDTVNQKPLDSRPASAQDEIVSVAVEIVVAELIAAIWFLPVHDTPAALMCGDGSRLEDSVDIGTCCSAVRRGPRLSPPNGKCDSVLHKTTNAKKRDHLEIEVVSQ